MFASSRGNIFLFVLTHNSGVGKLALWVSPNRADHSSYITSGDSNCREYSDEEMSRSNQGI
jgi:hypothetical protein